ncbi:MAG: DNA/RNA nuclease SfsA [Defluviitaleaceae bacterium]|nr:DNA/RNA nuclease SfsA [Defluviitaleaceae bacterium]
MTYNNIHKGIFHSRPNRFIAEVEVSGQLERCHVKNTGRCKELLVPMAEVYLNRTNNPKRTTNYDLVAVCKGGNLVNIDSQAPNHVFREYLETGKYIKDTTAIKAEVKYDKSRFDFYVETKCRKIFIEVKGVTLENNGVALFPDAPTERGVKHLRELAQSTKNGFEAHVVFIIQMKGICRFMPNYEIHPGFGTALVEAHGAGVKVNALDCVVTPGNLIIGNPVPVRLLNA